MPNIGGIEIVFAPSFEKKLGVKLDQEELQLRIDARVQTNLLATALSVTDEKEDDRLYKIVLHKMRQNKKD